MKPCMLLRLCLIPREIISVGEGRGGLRHHYNYHIQQVSYNGGIWCTRDF